MYTLLVVDDEMFTRKGIIKKVPTEPDGISVVLEARDGKEGLAIAQYSPVDIVLSDVRMPRMDGIKMCQEIRRLYPDCVIIFLSGYSDKEYLRSAISMQALQYIDKPVDTGALQEALSQAVSYCNEIRYSRKFVREANRKRLARLLLSSPPSNGQLAVALSESGHTYEDFRDSLTVIFQFLPGPDASDEKLGFHDTLEQCQETISEIIRNKHLPFLITDYRENHLILHFLSTPDRMVSSFSRAFWENLMREISEKTAAYPHFVSIGPIVSSPEEIYRSYNAAAINLQTLFYTGINSISFADEMPTDSYSMSQELLDAIKQTIHNSEQEKCFRMLKELEESFRSHPGTLISNTKENFYRLLSWLISYVKNKTGSDVLDTENYLWELISSANTLDELISFTRNYISLSFDAMQSGREASVSVLIKNTIIDNYQNPDLDIQFLSGRLNLSVSYLSFLFKQETGSTINHYMNEYRIWKAKELLVNTNRKIADISDAVGFANQNYFAKTFKKLAGCSPSVYRDLHVEG